MTVLLASDLDRTLIYSPKAMALAPGRPETVCVEWHEGKQSSFMTQGAAQTITELAGEAMVVPVTTRIAEQYQRVRLPGPAPRFAIAANGGLLYVDGTPDRTWSRAVQNAVATSHPLTEVWEHLGRVCSPHFTIKLRNAAGLFCYAVVHTRRLPAGFVDEVSAWAAERGWRTSLQGRKLYWVPDGLTKSAAVAEVARRCDAALVLAAGDSLLDVDLLLAADLGIHPRHGELFDSGWSAPTVTTTASAGIVAGEEVLTWFAAAVRRHRDGVD